MPSPTLPIIVHDLRFASTLQFSLALHLPRNINRMLYRLPRLLPQLLRELLGLFAPLLHFRVRPLEVVCQIEICLILALRDHITDEAAGVTVVEIDLRR